MTERWHDGALYVATGDPLGDTRRLENVLGERQTVVLESGDADDLQTLTHGLGRVPQGVTIINTQIASAGDMTWYRLNSDPDWTDRQLSLRFRADNGSVFLEII